MAEGATVALDDTEQPLAHVMPYWREGAACYASLPLRLAEQVTGPVATVDIDALLSDWHGKGSDEPPPIVA